MVKEKLYGKEFNVDGHDTKKEIEEIKELIRSGKLKKEDLPKIKDYINKDKRIVNELYLTNPADKALIQLLVKDLKNKKPDIFEDLKKHKLVDENGNLPNIWSGPKGVKFLQIMLNHLVGTNLKVDGAFGPNTFWALVQYQKQSNVYKTTTLADVQNFANSKNLSVTFRGNMSEVGMPDGLADGRTIYSMFQSIIKSEKIDASDKSKPDITKLTENTNNLKEKKNVGKQIDKKEEISAWQPTGYVENGHYYILGKNGEPRLVTFSQLSPEIKEKLEDYKEIVEKVELLNFLIQAAKRAGWKLSPKEIVEGEKEMSKLIQNMLMGKETLSDANKKIQDIFVKVLGNGADTYDLKVAFEKEKGENLRLKVLEFVRKELDQYGMVAENIMEKNFDLTNLSPEFIKKLEEAVKSGNYFKIKSLLSKNKNIKSWLKENDESVKDLTDKLFNVFEKIRQAERKVDFVKLAEKYSTSTHKITPEQIQERLTQKLVDSSVKGLLFDEFVDAQVDNSGNVIDRSKFKNGQVEELNLYSDIKGFGFWNLSDKSTDIVGELAELAAIEVAAMAVGAFTAGLGTAALEGLVAARWARMGYKLAEGATDLSKWERFTNVIEVGGNTYKVSKATKLAYSTAKVGVEGALFYEGTNFVQNFFEGRNLFEGAGDMKEILKSIVMVGVLQGLNKLMKDVRGLKNIQVKEGDNILKKVFKVSGQITIEGISLGAIGGTLDIVLDGGERTPEMFLEGIIMAAMFRGMGVLGEGVRKIRLKKEIGPDGKPEIKLLEYKGINKQTERVKLDNLLDVELKKVEKLKENEKANFNVNGREFTVKKLNKGYEITYPDGKVQKIDIDGSKGLDAIKKSIIRELMGKNTNVVGEKIIELTGKKEDMESNFKIERFLKDTMRQVKNLKNQEGKNKVEVSFEGQNFVVENTRGVGGFKIYLPNGEIKEVNGFNRSESLKQVKSTLENYLYGGKKEIKKASSSLDTVKEKLEILKKQYRQNEKKINKLEQELKKNEIKDHKIKKELEKIRHNIKKVGDSTTLTINELIFGIKMIGVGKYEITYPDKRIQVIESKGKGLKPIESSIKKEIRKIKKTNLIKDEISKLKAENERIKQEIESLEKTQDNLNKSQEKVKTKNDKAEETNPDKELEEKLNKIEDPVEKESKLKENMDWKLGNFRLSEKKFNRATTETKVENVYRKNDVIAIGDTHGNYKAFIKNLKEAGIIDSEGNWIAKDKDVVLLGDILGDRNAEGLKTLEKIYDLSKQAKEQGGSITLLAGNHDDFALSFLTGVKVAGGGNPIDNSIINMQGKGTFEFIHFLKNKPKVITEEEIEKFKANSDKISKEILENMKNSEIGRKLLDVISNYKIIEQIDDTLYTHTDFTSSMAKAVRKYGIDKINEIYQKGLKDLLEGKKPSKEFDEIRDIFLFTGNRSYLDSTEAKKLKKMGINRIVHGHTDHYGKIVNKGGLEITSIDYSFGKKGELKGKPSIGITRKAGDNTYGFTTHS